MGRWMTSCALGFGLALSPAGPLSAPAAAQCALCGITPGDPANAAQPLPLEIEVETALDFDRIIVEGAGSGLVRLMPDGRTDISGAVQSISGRARIGRLVLRGEPNRPVQVSFPDKLELVGLKGSVISIRSLVTNLPQSPVLDSTGQLAIDFGGELEVSGDSDGDFRGNLTVRADYL